MHRTVFSAVTALVAAMLVTLMNTGSANAGPVFVTRDGNLSTPSTVGTFTTLPGSGGFTATVTITGANTAPSTFTLNGATCTSG